jgi:hypothetical protein
VRVTASTVCPTESTYLEDSMGDIRPDQPADDTEGHSKRRATVVGTDDLETDDTEGHSKRRATVIGTDDLETDDTEGHIRR